jgi:arginase
MQRLSLIGIPLYTLMKYRGMGLAVHALRQLGIGEALAQEKRQFVDLGDISLRPLVVDSGPASMQNFQHFLESTDIISKRASEVDSQDTAFCLGGECGLVVGTIAGFRTKFKGNPGILWLDAHGDFNTPETTSSGFIGGMPLAMACGRGPTLSSQIEHFRPLLKEENSVHMGHRDLDTLESANMQNSPMTLYPASLIRKEKMEKIAPKVAKRLSDSADWIICHLDLDVLDPKIIPAVDFPTNGGLTLKEVEQIVHELRETGKLKIFNLTAYDPTLDQSQTSGKRIVNLVSEILA